MGFVSYELAMKLRFIGYNIPGRLYARFSETPDLFEDSAVKDWNTIFQKSTDSGTLKMCTAPTFDEVQRWLRNEKHIHIMLDCIGAKNWKPTVQDMYGDNDYVLEGKESRIGFNGFDSYEIALEVAINDIINKLVKA